MRLRVRKLLLVIRCGLTTTGGDVSGEGVPQGLLGTGLPGLIEAFEHPAGEPERQLVCATS